MLDVAALDKSLKLKSIGRLTDSGHAMLLLIRNCINHNQFFYPELRTTIDPFMAQAINTLGIVRRESIANVSLDDNVAHIRLIMDINVIKAVNPVGRLSIGFRLIWNANKRKLGQLTEPDLNLISRFMTPCLVRKCRHIISNNYAQIINPAALGNLNVLDNVAINDKFMKLSEISSKKIREGLIKQEVLTEFKIGLVIDARMARNWLYNVSQLTSVLHKNHILLTAHNAIYSKERCFRYGLTNDPNCPRCESIETLAHKIYECEYSKRIWDEVIKLSSRLENNIANEEDRIKQIFATVKGTNSLIISIHAEALITIIRLKHDAEWLVHPKILATNIIKRLSKLEKSCQEKEKLRNLLFTD